MGNFRSLIRLLFRMPNQSIGTKLFLIFFCFVAISLAGLGLLSFNIARNSIIEQMMESSKTMVTLASEKLDMKQSFYLDISNQLMNNGSFTKNLSQITSSGIRAEELQNHVADVRRLFDQILLSDANIHDITLIPLEDSIPIISTQRGDVDVQIDAKWLKSIQKAEGRSMWLPVEEKGYLGDSSKSLFAYGRLLGKNNIGTHDFILLVQIQTEVLQNLVNKMKLSVGAETLIVSNTNKVLASNMTKENGSELEIEFVNEGSRSFLKTLAGEEKLVTYQHSLVSNWLFVGIAPLSELTGSVNRIKNITYAFITVNILIALLIGLWIVLIVGKPLSEMRELIQTAAVGNLSGRLGYKKHKDEVGQVARAYNQMMEQISHLIIETRQTVIQVSESSALMTKVAGETAESAKEIHSATDEIAQGAMELADYAENGMSNMEQMNVSLSKVFTSQSKMSFSAHEVDNVCRRGTTSVNELLRKTDYTEKSLISVSERVNSLNASAESVQYILMLMKEMANKTKILSLNASIEATRAGGAGAGFNVIANEIRGLAEQSNASIGSVGNLTHRIQVDVIATVEALEKAMPFFREMIQEVHVVHELFLLIQVQMDQLVVRSSDVENLLANLDVTKMMLSRAMAEVSAVSQQSSASTEEVASLCSEQYSISKQLTEVSNKMKVVSEKLENHMKQFII